MDYDYQQTHFSKAVLAGLFAGIAATLANLLYDYVYRDITSYWPSEIINVSSIIVATTLLLTVAGIIFHLFRQYIKNGSTGYFIFFTALTALCIYGALHVQRSSDPVVTIEFRQLLLGVVIISGAAALLIPYLYRHSKIFC